MGITNFVASETSFQGGPPKQVVRIGVISSMDTVLIVEDSRPMQRTLQRLFESDSLQVQIAGDGPSGLEFFRKQLPAVVVLDLKLPGISGKELCREFKFIAAAVPIVVLSANSEVEDKVLLLELGADDYVTKPFSPKELLARVRRAMRRTASSATDRLSGRCQSRKPRDFDFRRRACRFHQHGGNALRKVHHPDHPGVQVVEVSRVFPWQSRLSRGTSQRSLGIPELSVDQNGGQSYPSPSPETGTRSRISPVSLDHARRRVQILTGGRSNLIWSLSLF